MEISKKLQDAMNSQINEEMYSSYLYLSMAAYFEDKNLGGFAHWLKLQAGEETKHAMKFYSHIIERGGRVELQEIKAPPKEWKSALAAFEDVYKHEQKISASISKIVDIAIELKEHASNGLLQWFTDEQVEEEDQSRYVLEKLKIIGDAKPLLIMLDRELAQRKD